MAESEDSGESAMAKSSNLSSKARDIIASSSHEELTIIVEQLLKRQESEEYKTARALYDFIVSDFPNLLILKLLKLYQSSSNGFVRFQTIYLLSETLSDFRDLSFKISIDTLYEIKPLLISCLTMKETRESDIKIFARIVSYVANNVMVFNHDKWDELGICILTLSHNQPLKAFHIFIDLPPVSKQFMEKFLHNVLEEAGKVFLRAKQDRVQDWSLAFKTVMKTGIQLVNTRMNIELVRMLMEVQFTPVMSSVNALVKNGMEEFLVKGLEDFERFLSRDMDLYHYTTKQCSVMSSFLVKIEGIGKKQTNEIVRKIMMLVTKQDIKPQEVVKKYRLEFERGWLDHLKNLSALEVFKIFASSGLEDRSREMAIRHVNVLLSDHISKHKLIALSQIRELQALLIPCLEDGGVSNSMFKVLGEVVNHVAYENFIYQDETWDELRDYIVSHSKTEFERAVYVFQCLAMALVDDGFLTPVIENLLPEINARLNPPTEALIDNSSWVLAFTGAFCGIIQSIDMPKDAEYVREIAHKMINSVGELVERRMEVGLVRRAFRDVESIVKKQLHWYSFDEYKFVKGLLWRLYAIEGMKGESKIVLWRINVILERALKGKVRYTPEEDEFEWPNLGDEEDEKKDDEKHDKDGEGL